MWAGLKASAAAQNPPIRASWATPKTSSQCCPKPPTASWPPSARPRGVPQRRPRF
ncbi:MAG: hypothetical protein WKG07_09530 [Hymenobacter sp.]